MTEQLRLDLPEPDLDEQWREAERAAPEPFPAALAPARYRCDRPMPMGEGDCLKCGGPAA